jgi:hypothetical protein
MRVAGARGVAAAGWVFGVLLLAGCARGLVVDPLPGPQREAGEEARRGPVVILTLDLERDGVARTPSLWLIEVAKREAEETHLFARVDWAADRAYHPKDEELALRITETTRTGANGLRGFLVAISLFTLAPFLPATYERSAVVELALRTKAGTLRRSVTTRATRSRAITPLSVAAGSPLPELGELAVEASLTRAFAALLAEVDPAAGKGGARR